MDPALLAGVNDDDEDNDEDASLAGVHDEDTSLTGVPVPNTNVTTHTDNESDKEPNHDSIDPNEADDNSIKSSILSTGSHISIHSATSEPPQNTLDEENDVELPKLETQVPILCQSERVSVPPSKYIPQMGGKTNITNIKTGSNKDEENGLVYNHNEARVLVTVITTFNKCMECMVEEHRQQHVVTHSLKAGINKFGN